MLYSVQAYKIIIIITNFRHAYFTPVKFIGDYDCGVEKSQRRVTARRTSLVYEINIINLKEINTYHFIAPSHNIGQVDILRSKVLRFLQHFISQDGGQAAVLLAIRDVVLQQLEQMTF